MTRTHRTRASRAMVLALLASAAAASISRADTYTWTGLGTTPEWDELLPDQTGANWTPSSTNIPGIGDDVIFGQGFTSGNPNLDGNRYINSFTIDSSNSFSIVGNPGDFLAIESGNLARTAASSGTQTFAVPVFLSPGTTQTYNFSLNGNGSVVFTRGLQAARYGAVTKSGSADLIFTGLPSSFDASFNITGGNLIVEGAPLTDTYVGDFQVQNSGSSIIVRNGGTLNSSGNVIASNSGSISVTGGSAQLNGFNIEIGAGSRGALNAGLGGQIAGTYLQIGWNDGGSGVVNLQSGVSTFEKVNLAPQGHSTGNLNISGSTTKLIPYEMSLNGDELNGTSNPSGVSTVNISSGATVEANYLSLYRTNAVLIVDGGNLVVDKEISGDAPTTINLQADPGGGHAMVIKGYASGLFSSITGSGSILFNNTSAPTFVTRMGGQNTYTGPTIIEETNLQISDGSGASSLYDVQTGSILGIGEYTQVAMNLGTSTILSEAGGEVDYDQVALNGGLIRGGGKNIVSGSDSVVFNGTTIGADATVSTVAATGTPTFNQVTVAGNLMLNSPLNINASTIYSSGRVDVNSGSNVNATLFTSNGTLAIHSGGTVTNTAANLTLGSGSITTLDNGGALTLANSTALDLRGGLLTNNGTINGPVNVYFGSVAKGSGTYSGALKVFEGGRVSPGNSPGILASTASAWNQGGIYHWDIADLNGPAGTAWDLWSAGTTSITPTGSFEIEIQSLGSLHGGGLQGWNPNQPYSWLIATADNGAFSADALSHLAIVDDGFADTNSLAGGTFSLTDSSDGNNLYMTFSPAPEPGSVACIVLFASGMLLKRRRHCF